MSTEKHVSDALSIFSTIERVRDALAVHTHCLYPDNSVVTVLVRGGPGYGFIVSDEGRAVDELTAHNREMLNPDRFLSRFCRREGLVADRGKIRSERVGAMNLASAVSFVANASARAVYKGLEVLKVRRPSNLKEDLASLLNATFPAQNIRKDVRIQGKSTRTYRFESVVDFGSRRLVIDPVTRDSNSINAHAIAHMDIGRLGDPGISQRLVYDEKEEWPAADLALLQTAATIVPYSKSEEVFGRFRNSAWPVARGQHVS